jgi:AbiV family abortive infection protein
VVKKKKFSSAYRGTLTPERAAEGIRAARENAQRLRDDARLLLENGRFPSAAALAILAIEEFGKIPILQSVVAAGNDRKQLAKAWLEYRQHASKNQRWLMPHLADQGPQPIEGFAALFSPELGLGQLAEELKQAALYTVCSSEMKWQQPSQEITLELADFLVNSATRIVSADELPVEVIELNARYMALIPQCRTIEEKKALVLRFFEELRGKGYTTVTEELARLFLYGKVDLRGAGLPSSTAMGWGGDT